MTICTQALTCREPAFSGHRTGGGRSRQVSEYPCGGISRIPVMRGTFIIPVVLGSGRSHNGIELEILVGVDIDREISISSDRALDKE